jgi:6-pyruvoyl-tetrahydropterin synthase
MIAHSFRGELFGPAQRLHGATYVIDLELRGEELHESGVLIDIGLATEALRAALEPLRYQNLDTLPELTGVNTTTEVLAKHVLERVRERIAKGELGAGSERLCELCVTFNESHVASASYTARLERG